MRTATRLRRRWRLAAVVSILPIAVIGAVLVTTQAASGATETTLATFGTPGTYLWVVPSGVTKVTFDVYGAGGGGVVNGSVLYAGGGAGGETKATFKVKPGFAFEIVVGGRGGDTNGFTLGAGGFNGGGDGIPGNSTNFILGGGGGGGASDVRVSGSGSGCARLSPPICAFDTRIVVAGGGGGGISTTTGSFAADGGAGGGFAGTAGGLAGGALHGGCGGAQTSGTCGTDFGVGFWGGGGGWYGGGTEDWSVSNGVPALEAAGGGSGYYSGLVIKASFPGGTRSSDGLVIVQTP